LPAGKKEETALSTARFAIDTYSSGGRMGHFRRPRTLFEFVFVVVTEKNAFSLFASRSLTRSYHIQNGSR
jgi:hypothetical protein